MKELIEGVDVKMGGSTWIVPALSLGQIKRLKNKINGLHKIGEELTDEQIQDIGDIVHSAMSRNYPEVTRSEVEDMVDLANLQQVIKAVMAQSGLVQSGEAKAVNR